MTEKINIEQSVIAYVIDARLPLIIFYLINLSFFLNTFILFHNESIFTVLSFFYGNSELLISVKRIIIINKIK